jgi:hypothetical protein
MANEITINASLSFSKAGVTINPVGATFTNLQFNVAGLNYVENVLSVGTSATVIPLGSVTAPHFAVFQNMDPTNYLTIFNGASGAVLARLRAGEPALIPLDPAAVPYATANTAACVLSYLIIAQ